METVAAAPVVQSAGRNAAGRDANMAETEAAVRPLQGGHEANIICGANARSRLPRDCPAAFPAADRTDNPRR